jgi:hypothetical protein
MTTPQQQPQQEPTATQPQQPMRISEGERHKQQESEWEPRYWHKGTIDMWCAKASAEAQERQPASERDAPHR